MERNQSQFITSGIVGSNDTLGDEVVFSKLHNKTSVSFGQYYFHSNGFRENNGQKHNIINAFIQHAFTPKLNVQAELRRRETEHGDLLLDFRTAPRPLRRKLEDNSVRIGARYKLSSDQDLLVSGKYIDANDNLNLINLSAKFTGFQFEAQHLLRYESFNTIFGGGIYRLNLVMKQDGTKFDLPFEYRDRKNIYQYTNINFLRNLNLTLGLSYDTFTSTDTDATKDKINPKFGVQWNIFDNLRLRAAWFETTKSISIAQQTLEPTQVAGFNQFFDDFEGARTRRMGIGLDYHASHTLYGGLEASKRILHVPLTTNVTFLQEQKEYLYRSYLYWTPHPFWVVKGEFQFERFVRSPEQFEQLLNEPIRIHTLSAPISVKYFHPSGVFSGITGTFVEQDLTRISDIGKRNERDPESTNSGVDAFFLLDTVIGFRLPNRKGVLSFEGRNLLNEQFFYRNANLQDNSFINLNYSPTRTYIPERTFFARLTWNF